jgi:hypothetical protein
MNRPAAHVYVEYSPQFQAGVGKSPLLYQTRERSVLYSLAPARRSIIPHDHEGSH